MMMLNLILLFNFYRKNLINDKMYAMNYFKRCTRLGIGHNKAIYNLRNYGVDTEIIDTCLEELDDDEEYQAAMLLINNYYQRNNTISYRNIQRKIKEKLFLKDLRMMLLIKQWQSMILNMI